MVKGQVYWVFLTHTVYIRLIIMHRGEQKNRVVWKGSKILDQRTEQSDTDERKYAGQRAVAHRFLYGVVRRALQCSSEEAWIRRGRRHRKLVGRSFVRSFVRSLFSLIFCRAEWPSLRRRRFRSWTEIQTGDSKICGRHTSCGSVSTSRSSCSRLPSAATSTLVVPATRRRTLGDRAFPVAAARAWNSLPSFVRYEQSLAAFRRQLKTVLFRTSFGLWRGC